jgi:adenosylhomocysteinase
VDAFHVGGKRIFVLAEGRLVNLAAAEGHPASVMDMSFATQALASAWIAKKPLPAMVYDVPLEIENDVATLKLESMGVSMDTLTKEQKSYLSGWQHGT